MTLKWTKTRPTEADVGKWFCFRMYPGGPNWMMKIVMRSGELIGLGFQDNLQLTLKFPVFPDHYEFAGPIPEPVEDESTATT